MRWRGRRGLEQAVEPTPPPAAEEPWGLCPEGSPPLLPDDIDEVPEVDGPLHLGGGDEAPPAPPGCWKNPWLWWGLWCCCGRLWA